MQAQIKLYQTLDGYSMLDFANGVLEQCWDICYDRNLTREELKGGSLSDKKEQQMEACGRKCTARHFEVMKLSLETMEQYQREMAGMAA